MVLQPEQIRRIIKDGTRPAVDSEKQSCDKHDSQNRFHCEPSMTFDGVSYKSKFGEFVGTLIASEKMAVFNALLRTPISTVGFTESVFDELAKIFEAQDRHVEYRFTNPNLTVDFEQYLKSLKDDTFWQTTGFNAMKTAINSIVVIDLPQVAPNAVGFSTPYYYLLDVQKIHDIEVDATYKVEYIAFRDRYDDNKLHVFDDVYYRTFSKAKNDEWELVTETQHMLGYTPARSFWTTPFKANSRIQKLGPQSNSLTDLDWLLFMKTSTRHVELYAGFPIDVVYESKCGYKDAAGNECNGGVVRWNDYSLDGSAILIPHEKTCPVCHGGSGLSLGAGSRIIAPAMSSNTDPDMLQGMNRISADKDSLEYLMARCEKLEVDISVNMVGVIAEGIRQAMNKDQVASFLESQINCLSEVRDNFQAIDKFVKETLARLRYGPQAVVDIVVNYGSKWFLHTVEQQQGEYKESKANGAPNFELSSQYEQILATKYKGNPTMLERMRTLFAIEPYQNYTVADLGTLEEKFGLNTELVRLKIDFMTYVNRFERQYMNLGTFMNGIPFEVKVAFVQEKLLEYVAEDYPEEDEEQQTDPAIPPGAIPPSGANPPIV